MWFLQLKGCNFPKQSLIFFYSSRKVDFEVNDLIQLYKNWCIVNEALILFCKGFYFVVEIICKGKSHDFLKFSIINCTNSPGK